MVRTQMRDWSRQTTAVTHREPERVTLALRPNPRRNSTVAASEHRGQRMARAKATSVV